MMKCNRWIVWLAVLVPSAGSTVCAQCLPLSGGGIFYCPSISRSVSATRNFGTPMSLTNATTGSWNQSVLVYDSNFDSPPNPDSPSLVFAGAGYAQQNCTLGPDAVAGTMRGIAWDGNQGYGGMGSATLSTQFELAWPVTCIISGSWSTNGSPGAFGDGTMPNVFFSLSGPPGGNYAAGYVNPIGPNPPPPILSGTLNFRATIPAGSYTLSARAGEAITYTFSNVGARTGRLQFSVTMCRADFNGDGSVGVQDIFDFLAAYFAQAPRADFNSSGAISVQDIFDFFAAYFEGCP